MRLSKFTRSITPGWTKERQRSLLGRVAYCAIPPRKLTRGFVIFSLLVPFWSWNLRSGETRTRDLADLSIEELMNEPVTSVSKRETKLNESAAAIFVISQEDIRHSGMTSIPELLRMVPGLNVARIDANLWAVSARGFNGQFARKMQVLIDGRSVYTPLFSGVYWDVQDLILEDIERIEVIRGPGATLWGANAVNGVINIITKQAEDTQGGLVSAVSGGEDHGIGSVRYGGKLGQKASYRTYAKYSNRDNLVDSAGAPSFDRWSQVRGGFRTDWTLSPNNSLTVQGDIYAGHSRNQVERLVSLTPPSSPKYTDRSDLSGGNLLARWNHDFSMHSDITVQFYYDQTERTSTDIQEHRATFDFDFQHHWEVNGRHDLVWGLGLRNSDDKTRGGLWVSFDPANFSDSRFNAFVQDEITLVPNRLNLTLGSKFEQNSFTGMEVQPTGRLLWTLHPRHSLWGAVSRAVSFPSRATNGVRVNLAAFPGGGGSFGLLSLFGNPNSKSEELLAHELGYRVQPNQRVFLDVATFYNRYDNLFSLEPAAPFLEMNPFPPHGVFPVRFDNRIRGETYGAELAATFHVNSHWKLSSSYSWLKLQLHRDASSGDTTSESQEGDNPHHQWVLRSQLNLPRNLEFDTAWYFVSKLVNQNVPRYHRVDARLGWQMNERLNLSIGIQNGLDPRHAEFGPANGFVSTQMKRSAYGRFTCRF